MALFGLSYLFGIFLVEGSIIWSFPWKELKNWTIRANDRETESSRWHVLCDDARMLSDDIVRVCPCFDL